MGFISSLKNNISKRARAEKRAGKSMSTTSAKWFLHLFGGKTRSGINVTPELALTYTAWYSGVNLIARNVGMLPFHLYKHASNDGRERQGSHRIDWLMNTQPNPEMTPYIFRSTMQGWVCNWGNAYAEIERADSGKVVALWPISPNIVSVKRDQKKELVYLIQQNGRDIQIAASDMLHIRTLGDGLVGWSPVKLFAESIGLGLAAEKHSATFFGNDSTPAGVLSMPGSLDEDQAKRLKETWHAAHSGEKSHSVAVLEEGLSWQATGMPASDAQLIEQRQFGITEVARVLGIPPHKLGDLSHATFSNIEEQGIEWVTDGLQPWLIQWQQECNRKLLAPADRGMYLEFNTSALLRGNTKGRYDAYAVGVQNGWMSPNDIRRLENMNPIPDGDIYLVPMNMTPLDKAVETIKQVGKSETKTFDKPSTAMRSLLADSCGRILRKEIKALERHVEDTESLERASKRLYSKHESYVGEVLAPGVAMLVEGRAGVDADEVVRRFAEQHVKAAIQSMTTGSLDERRLILDNWRDTGPENMVDDLMEILSDG